MKSYTFWIIFISIFVIFCLAAQDIQDDGIEFICNDIENETGYYWPKIGTNDSFAYIDDTLYHNIIESEHEIENTILDYLGHFSNNASEIVYLYGQIDETSQIENDDDNEIYDDEYEEDNDNN